jgi:hypothetical protein
MATPQPAPAPNARRPRLSKSGRIGLGLLFTFLGLFLLSDLIPSAPGRLLAVLPIAGVGMLVLWLGGILMGVGSRS